MLSEEEKKEYEELKSLLYTGTISQYGKRKLTDLIEKQFKKIEELKEGYKIQEHNYQVAMEEIEQRWEDKIKAKIEGVHYKMIAHQDVREAVKQVLNSLLEKEQ